MIFMRVDLPAPFSPKTACASPGLTDKDTERLATTPGYRLVMLDSDNRAGSGECMEFSKFDKFYRSLRPQASQAG